MGNAHSEPVTRNYPEFEKSEIAAMNMGEACVWMHCNCEGVELSRGELRSLSDKKYHGFSQLQMKQEFEFWYEMLGK